MAFLTKSAHFPVQPYQVNFYDIFKLPISFPFIKGNLNIFLRHISFFGFPVQKHAVVAH